MVEINGEKRCEHCFGAISESEKSCPYCSGKLNKDRYPTALTEGNILIGRYMVGQVLGKGGFGITYLCFDLKKNKKVAIKEYLPDSLTHRNTGESHVSSYDDEREEHFRAGAKKFYEEASLISKFSDTSNIISVFEFFFENNTAYFVMEYLEGMDLKHYAAQYGNLKEGQALYILLKMADALTVVHNAEVLHRDISPDNIFICNGNEVKLIDFGAARQIVIEASKSLSVILKHGFAPIEQYQRRGKQGPWTDIYALGVTIYYVLTGRILDDAMSRLEDDTVDGKGVSPELMRIIEKMIAVKVQDRYQSMPELKEDLEKLDIAPEPLLIKTERKQPESISASKSAEEKKGKNAAKTDPGKRTKKQRVDFGSDNREKPDKGTEQSNGKRIRLKQTATESAGKLKKILIAGALCTAVAAGIAAVVMPLKNRVSVSKGDNISVEQTIQVGESFDMTSVLPQTDGEWEINLSADNGPAVSIEKESAHIYDIRSEQITVTGIDIGEATINVTAECMTDKNHRVEYDGSVKLTVVMSDTEKAEVENAKSELNARLEEATAVLTNVRGDTSVDQAKLAAEEQTLETALSDLKLKIDEITRSTDIEEANKLYSDAVKPAAETLTAAYENARASKSVITSSGGKKSSGGSSSSGSSSGGKSSGGKSSGGKSSGGTSTGGTSNSGTSTGGGANTKTTTDSQSGKYNDEGSKYGN